MCGLLIKPELKGTKQVWLMGDPFLRAYYSIYDMDNNKIGLVGIADSIDTYHIDTNSLLLYILIGGGSCLATALFCCICQYLLWSRRQQKQQVAPATMTFPAKRHNVRNPPNVPLQQLQYPHVYPPS